MKRSQVIVIGMLIFMLMLLLFNSFITKIFSAYSICAFVLLLIIISYLLLGFEKVKSRYSKDIILSIIIYIAIYYIAIYLFGLFLGFNRNIYSLSIATILKNIIPIIFLIPLSEILRYILNTKIKNNYYLLGLSIIIFTLIDVTFTLRALNFKDFYLVLKIVGLFILPSLGKNFLLTYLSVKISFKPNIVYRYLMELPKYIVPIVPNFGNYVESIVYITFPILVFIIIYNKFRKVEKKNVIIKSKNNKKSKFIYYIIIIFLIMTVTLTSGYFKYQAIVIATGSMKPNINKGDVVITKKITDEDIEKLQLGDILVFNRDNKIIVHRIYKIYNSGNEIFFQTKGDNNNAPDGYLIETSEVIGVVKLNVRYIGYPTIALYDSIKG